MFFVWLNCASGHGMEKPSRRWRNLRILIIENTIFSTCPKHLPNSLRVLGWSCYPSPTMSSKYAVQICSCFLIFIYCSKSLEGTGTGGIADAGNHQCISGFETNFLR